MQTMILASAWSTSIQRNKRPTKGKQPNKDDQPGPEFVFRSSWICAMSEKCNQVIIELSNFILSKIVVTYLFLRNCVWPTFSCFLIQIFVLACHNGHFVMLVVDCLVKVFYFYDSLPSATHRDWALILVNTYFSFQFFC